MPAIDCGNDDCGCEIDVELSTLNSENNGSSGTHTTWYTYTGSVTCPECEYENEVTFTVDVLDDTGEVLTCERA